MSHDGAHDPFTDRRGSRRHRLNIPGRAIQDGYEIPCKVIDISETGARVEFDPVAIVGLRGTRCSLRILDISEVPARIIWKAAYSAGMRFEISPLFQNLLKRSLAKHLSREVS